MASEQRTERLRKLFLKMLNGDQQVKSSQNAQHFLEATRMQPSPSACVERIISSKKGLDAFKDAIRVDLSSKFILSQTLPSLSYLSDPAVKDVADGQLLHQILAVIAEPPTVWNEIIQLLTRHQIPDALLTSFAWLAYELLSLPSKFGVDVLAEVRRISEQGVFVDAQNHGTREFGYRIKKVLQVRCSPQQATQADSPGGRHDNDHDEYRKIRIYPTKDEFLSTQPPFYLTAAEVLATPLEHRAGVHLANQFRLLREDMVAELREDHQVAIGAKKGKRFSLSLGGLRPVGLDFGDEEKERYKKCTLLLQCFDGLQHLKKMDPEARKKYLHGQANFLRHQAFGVLCRGNEIFGFAFIDRDIDRLVQSPPILSLQFTDDYSLRSALLAFTLPNAMFIRFILVDTAVFAYEPVLTALQDLSDLPLQDMLVDPTSANLEQDGMIQDRKLRCEIEKLKGCRSKASSAGSVELPSSDISKIRLDESQLAALLCALTTPLSLIQGPPGTGKSFIGAQIAKYFWQSGKRILVISFTNHALNQFLEDLIKAGIQESTVVRIGAKAKCSPDTLPLLLSEQKGSYRRSQYAWAVIQDLKMQARKSLGTVKKAYGEYARLSISWKDISEHLEFTDDDLDTPFYEALRVPDENSDWNRAGRRGQKIQPDFLYEEWKKGKDIPKFLSKTLSTSSKLVWDMPKSERQVHLARWTQALLQERLELFQRHVRRFNNIQEKIGVHFGEPDTYIIQQKRVIGCTTTGAAKYSRLIRAAKPDVILVEEAGEILESHVLTALTPTVKQLVLIGDHKQLRPKINNYALSVEKGDGFDLNRSLFERLIIQGASHATLSKQHRMVPEISRLPRQLTYPDLVDGPKTSGRPPIRGLRDRVVFVNHCEPEASDQAINERRDPGVKESKKNFFEAEMVLRCVKYFGQQGYSSDQIVVLTPYLGQLRALQDLLRDNELYAELSEMDKMDLIRAGLLSNAAAQVNRTPLRISTIDNYQGEESDIVIASLTRSNEAGDIGFMSAPERLNVLITRARDCLVLIGNMQTFIRSKKGASTWHPFFELLKDNGNLYDGLPVRCEKHPDRTALLKEPKDFATSCPDGGCAELCNAILKCRLHNCKSRCHRITDHSKTECHQPVEKTCDRQHKTKVTCARRSDGCAKCIQEDKQEERRIKRDLGLEKERVRREEAYTKQLQQLDDEIEHERRIDKYRRDEQEQKNTLEQRRADLETRKDANKRAQEQQQRKELLDAQTAKATAQVARDAKAAPMSPDLGFDPPEGSRAEWEQLKRSEGAQSKPMDELMSMIGLEAVKQEFLSIKSKVDLALRQGTSLASDRFSCSMLGNPGTGKTTVARLYAQFLTAFGVIPGTCFKETTGAAAANAGVSGCKNMINDILNDGGGVLFLDEAYQLTSGNNPGGGAVLDYLLAEVENLRGRVVFVLAGYSKQMEAFFAHNPGLPSRFPIGMNFADYQDDELLRILELKVNKKYNGLMKCEDGLRGLYCRIIARRIGYGRGKDGFGNARTVENTLSVVSKRQADRIRRERKAGPIPDDMFMTKEDLIGPEPSEALTKCAAWKKLNKDLIGLGAVKDAVKALVDSIQQNYQRELAEKPPIQYSLNKVFLGNPGTGKTTVAKLYGEILVALGLLSKGEVVIKNPSDFVGAALGQSEQNTKGILASAVGKVLVIDEAYGLCGGGDNSSSDPYKTAVIDTIVAEVQSVPGEDRCVLLLGYKDQMEKMFQNVNPGLSRRFPIASGFSFEDFSQDELRNILDLKLKQQGYRATNEAKRVAMEMLDRARNRPNFGNAGEIDILLDATKARHQKRLSQKAGGDRSASSDVLGAEDFDLDFDRAERSETNIRALFQDTVGSDRVVELLEGYQDTVRTLKSLDMDPKENIPFNFLFRGPPGTGKTTTAKKMGKVFYDMGFLATAEVVECSATDLIGQYVGQTGPKVQKLLDKALGRVLFVDEAYRLGEGHFAKEAMDELVDSVTKERYHKKLIIILAGYDADINRLMTVNAGLTSRFPATIDFRALTPDECIALLLQLLQKQREALRRKDKDLELSCLETPTHTFGQRISTDFGRLATQDGWASARDVQSLAKGIFNKLLRSKAGLEQGRLTLDEETISEELNSMIDEREARHSSGMAVKPLTINLKQPLPQAPPKAPPPAASHTTTTISNAQAKAQETGKEETTTEEEPRPIMETRADEIDHSHDHMRDAGVSDAVWEQLQRDRKEEEAREKQYQQLRKAAKQATAAAKEKLVKMLLEAERKREEEEEKKKKLAASGKCPVGYSWIKQGDGYRCEGGSHWMSGEEVSKL